MLFGVGNVYGCEVWMVFDWVCENVFDVVRVLGLILIGFGV